jgi:hypothetical protein
MKHQSRSIHDCDVYLLYNSKMLPTCQNTMPYPSFFYFECSGGWFFQLLNSDVPLCRKCTQRCYRQPCCAYAMCMEKKLHGAESPFEKFVIAGLLKKFLDFE